MQYQLARTSPDFEELSSIPVELREIRRWVVWSEEGGKKVPYAAATGKRTNVTSSIAGSDFELACQTWSGNVKYDGIGFIFNGDGLVGIDIDDCIINGEASSAAIQILEDAGCRYVEISPSGTGLHGIGLANDVIAGCRASIAGAAVEVYTKDRYFTMTGNLYLPYRENGRIAFMDGFPNLIARISARKSTRLVSPNPTQETHETHVTQETQVAQETNDTHDAQEPQAGGSVPELKPMTFPPSCIPDGYGQRNFVIFQLARFLKGKYPESKQDDLHHVVKAWFDQFVEKMRTKDFGQTWADFLVAWTNVQSPYGQSLAAALEIPVQVPEWMRAHRFGQRGDNLLTICCALAKHHAPDPFFLSARVAGDLLDADFSDCAKLLKAMQHVGFIELVEQGRRGTASTYRLGTAEMDGLS
jgi:hypothetical protein